MATWKKVLHENSPTGDFPSGVLTNTTNVTSAGALMDGECSDVDAVKNINQELTTSSDVQFNDIRAGDMEANALMIDGDDAATVETALMDSECTSVSSLKGINQGLTTSSNVQFGNIGINSTALFNLQIEGGAGNPAQVKLGADSGQLCQIVARNRGSSGTYNDLTLTAESHLFNTRRANSVASSVNALKIHEAVDANTPGKIEIHGTGQGDGNNYYLPTADGDADQVIKTDGSGNLSFVDQSGGGGGGTVYAEQRFSFGFTTRYNDAYEIYYNYDSFYGNHSQAWATNGSHPTVHGHSVTYPQTNHPIMFNGTIVKLCFNYWGYTSSLTSASHQFGIATPSYGGSWTQPAITVIDSSYSSPLTVTYRGPRLYEVDVSQACSIGDQWSLSWMRHNNQSSGSYYYGRCHGSFIIEVSSIT